MIRNIVGGAVVLSVVGLAVAGPRIVRKTKAFWKEGRKARAIAGAPLRALGNGMGFYGGLLVDVGQEIQKA
jgi:hypothetical protein